MAGEWPLVTIGEIAESISDTHKLDKNHLIFLNTSDILLGKILHNTYSAVRGWPGQAKKSIRKNDILFSEIRPANGRWAFIDIEADDYVVSTKLMVIRSRENRVIPRFLYHFLTSTETTRWLQHLAESRSGTFPQITFDQVAELELSLPPLKEQAAIVNFFDYLTNKIELNRRMNETLEAMARALFKSWFVDFDPVRAKAEGRDTGLPKHIADLFPARFVDSDLGEIPEGWEVQSFADTVEIIGGGTPKTSVAEYWDGNIPWFSVVDAPSPSEIWVCDTEKKITQRGVDASSTKVLTVGTTIITARGTVGRLALVGIPMAMNQSCYGLRGKLGTKGVFNYFATRVLVGVLQQRAHGSVFDTITRDTLAGVSTVVPTNSVVSVFEYLIGSIVERILKNVLLSRSLSILRDALLPRLISGELRVEDAEKFIGRTLE